MDGHMELDNDAVLMGRFEGTLKVSGVLDLMETARFQGLIITGTLRLAGKVQADVIAGESVELLKGAELRGRVFTPRLSVAEGVVLEADACIGPSAAQQAEKRLAQIELRAQLAGTDQTNAVETDQPAPLSIAADDASPEKPIELASESAAHVAEVDAAEVRTMSEAFERILSFRPSKVMKPPAPMSSMFSDDPSDESGAIEQGHDSVEAVSKAS